MRALGDVLTQLEKLAEIKLSPRQLFTYVPFPEDLRQRFESLAKNLIPGGKVARDLDHITLLYIPKAEADVAHDRVDEVVRKMRDVCEHVRPIKAKVQGWGYFDGATEDGVTKTALVGLIDAPGLEDLHVELKSAVRQLGLKEAGTHIFTPHVTFAYLDQGERVKDLPVLDGEFEIDRIVFANADKHEVKLLGSKSLGEKAAAVAAEEKDSETVGTKILRGGKGVLGSMVGSGLLGAGMLGLDKLQPQISGLDARARAVGDLSQRMGMREIPSVNYFPVSSAAQAGYIHNTEGGHVQLPDSISEAIAAHEVGHARNWQGVGTKPFEARARSSSVGNWTSIPAFAYAAGAKDPSYAPALAQAALMAPTLLDEGAASARAVAALVGKHGLGRGLMRSLPLIPAFGTYALAGLGPLGLTALRKHMNRAPLAEASEPSLGKEAARVGQSDPDVPAFIRRLSRDANALSTKAETREDHRAAMKAHDAVGKLSIAKGFHDFGDEHKGKAHDHWVAKAKMAGVVVEADDAGLKAVFDQLHRSLNGGQSMLEGTPIEKRLERMRARRRDPREKQAGWFGPSKEEREFIERHNAWADEFNQPHNLDKANVLLERHAKRTYKKTPDALAPHEWQASYDAAMADPYFVALHGKHFGPAKHAERVDRCKVCDAKATVKVRWAEGHGYQPACEAHKEQVAKPFKAKDDFSGFGRYR